MPTTRPRHTLTETDELAAAIELAAEQWPDDKGHRGRLLTRVIVDWASNQRESEEAHRRVLAATSGRFPGLAEVAELEALRREWPE